MNILHFPRKLLWNMTTKLCCFCSTETLQLHEHIENGFELLQCPMWMFWLCGSSKINQANLQWRFFKLSFTLAYNRWGENSSRSLFSNSKLKFVQLSRYFLNRWLRLRKAPFDPPRREIIQWKQWSSIFAKTLETKSTTPVCCAINNGNHVMISCWLSLQVFKAQHIEN